MLPDGIWFWCAYSVCSGYLNCNHLAFGKQSEVHLLGSPQIVQHYNILLLFWMHSAECTNSYNVLNIILYTPSSSVHDGEVGGRGGGGGGGRRRGEEEEEG